MNHRSVFYVLALFILVSLSLVVWTYYSSPVSVKVSGVASKTKIEPSEYENKVQEITIDRSVLDKIASEKCRKLELELFDGEIIKIEINPDRRQSINENGVIIHGKVDGEPESNFYASIVQDAMFAELLLEDGREFRIDFAGGDRFKVVEVNTTVVISHWQPGHKPTDNYIIVNGERQPVAKCYGIVVPKPMAWRHTMLKGADWTPNIKVVEEEFFVSSKDDNPQGSLRQRLRLSFGHITIVHEL